MTTTLPAPVEGYVEASNAFDGDALIACFADDAMVNDARRQFWGAGAIRRWLDRELIGDKVTMQVSSVVERGSEIVVNAIMDGTYNKTGLPDPLVLTHYFTVHDDRITQLIIILNEPTPDWAAA
jgi:hypothetical protein